MIFWEEYKTEYKRQLSEQWKLNEAIKMFLFMLDYSRLKVSEITQLAFDVIKCIVFFTERLRDSSQPV
jgi:hypothetical protein